MKLNKKLMAAALAVIMTISAASLQAMAAASGVPGTPTAAAAQSMTDRALYNSVGLGGDSNSLMSWQLQEFNNLTINTFSGNVTYTQDLFHAEVSEWPLMELSIAYNSQDTEDFGMGPGWRTNYNQQLIKNADGSYTFVDETGTRIVIRNGVATINGEYYYLNNEDGVMVVRAGPNGYFFDDNGRLTKVYGGGLIYNYTIEVTYNDLGWIDTLTPYCFDQGSRRIKFHYALSEDEESAIMSFIERFPADVNNQMVQFARFTYDENGRLIIDNETWQQKVYLHIDPNTKLLHMVDNNFLEYARDGLIPRAAALSNKDNQQYQYLYGNNQTVVIDPTGTMQLRNFDENGVWINT